VRPERWRRVDELLEAALEREGGSRDAFLEAACAGDSSLRREVEELLGCAARAEGFIETPAFNLAAMLLTGEADPTVARGDYEAARKASPKARATSLSSDSIDDARFVPGDVLAERYRVVGLLGRGGMGEVYRADDLKLKQPVALKFLPDRLSSDGAALARFYQEVSVARRVSHRHVCRVYDVGESAGQHFISMEYVRGEELSSLLKRIGRLPHDKAVEVARQLCAGLAAVHEQGVLHKDLKPSNVMVDERGDVRITDFGIAAYADEARGREAPAGTPAYMSPEQLEGRELSARSDVYSLGLVLYEIFTGKRAYEAASLAELLRLRRGDSQPTNPSSLVPNLDPLVERVVLRCIEREPARRPASALQVAAALPGGDPLAAALAAGETPSPEMVAGAPKEGSLRPAVAASLLASVFVGLALVMFLSGRSSLHRLAPLDKSSEVLRERAGEIARGFGYAPTEAADFAYGFDVDREYLAYVQAHDSSPRRWDALKAGQPAALFFWWRQSPRHLVPFGGWQVGPNDPPNDVSGMTLVALDTAGRMTYFEAAPQQQESDDSGESGAAADWSKLFREAGFDAASFREAESKWSPPQPADARAAWDGAYPGRPDAPVRVEAASYRGRPVYFEVVGPWRKPSRQAASESDASDLADAAILLTLYFGALALGALLAWRNLRLGRGDRRGAFRLTLFVFAIRMLYWAVYVHHVPTFAEVEGLLVIGIESALFWACFIGMMYLALEPFLRRRRPEWVISWSRLLAGDFRDPLVGRDLLVGALFGVSVMLALQLSVVAPQWFGRAPQGLAVNSSLVYSLGLLGPSGFLPLLINQVSASVLFTFILSSLLLFFSLVLRRERLGLAACWLVIFALAFLRADDKTVVGALLAVLVPTLLLASLTRFGLLAMISTILFVHLTVFFPVTTEFSAWYASSFLLDLAVLVAVALYGFRTSLAGQRLFGGSLLDD
jgi:predicted Ser/Thr protein kinase